MSKELYISVHVTTDDVGNIERIVLTDRLPVMEVEYLKNLLTCLEKAKVRTATSKETEETKN